MVLDSSSATAMSLRNQRVIIVTASTLLAWIFYYYVLGRGPPRPTKSFSRSSVTTVGQEFRLEGQPFRILSGSIHYFRVPPEYWKDRLWKLKAMGLNTVETYVAWNLHEAEPGKFDFKTGMRDIETFIKMAQSLGLHVIVRPGPYICAEWDMGGLPAWLLRDPTMVLRSMHKGFIDAVDRFFDHLLPIIVPLQRINGGPIIAVQVENEYGSYADDIDYMMYIKTALISRGIKEMLFTSDGGGVKPWGDLLQTVNFQRNLSNIKKLLAVQPNRPVMVTEYWSGWFDHWGEQHSVFSTNKAVDRIGQILSMGASINLYMFHGGTNFGFTNGANDGKMHELPYAPTITSYDYDSPLSEAGDITDKYVELRKLMVRYAQPPFSLPSTPRNVEKLAYKSVRMEQYVKLIQLSKFTTGIYSKTLHSMERLPIHDGAGQSYGFTLYDTRIKGKGSRLKISGVKDRGIVIINEKPMETIELGQHSVDIDLTTSLSSSTDFQLSILVENCGRVNFGQPPWFESKGLLSDVEVDGTRLKQWTIFPFEFETHFLEKIEMMSPIWKPTPAPQDPGPVIYKGKFMVSGEPKDTFLNLKKWMKGVVFVNNFNLGRYWQVGPQETLYIPAPLLKKGENTLLILELHVAPSDLTVNFQTTPALGQKNQKERN
jgi:hypothetical protein